MDIRVSVYIIEQGVQQDGRHTTVGFRKNILAISTSFLGKQIGGHEYNRNFSFSTLGILKKVR